MARVALTGVPPTVNRCTAETFGERFDLGRIAAWPPQCSMPGQNVELMWELCRWRGWPCPTRLLPDNQWGANSSGEWDGIIRLIKDGEVDTGGGLFGSTPRREAVVEFSTPVYFAPSYFVTRPPSPADVSFGALHAFRPIVWLFILGATVLLAVLSEMVEPRGGRPMSRKRRMVRKWLDYLSVFLGQGDSESPNSATKQAFTAWALSCIVLSGIYSASIMASVVKASTPPPFTDPASFAKCLRSRLCRLHIPNKSLYQAQLVLHAKEGSPLRPVLEALEENPMVLEPKEVTKERMRSETGGYVVTMAPSMGGLEIYITDNDPCSIRTVTMDFSRTAFPFPKGSGLLAEVNQAVHEMAAAGVEKRIRNRYIARRDETVCSRPPAYAPMGIWGLVGALVVLAAGCVFSAAFLASELVGTWLQ